MKKIVVLNFGSQVAQLISSKIRRAGAFCEIWSNETEAEKFDPREIAGIIFSGGPASVFAENSPTVDPRVFNLQIPILAICYGHQLTAQTLGGSVAPAKVREFGAAQFSVEKPLGIFKNFPTESTVWMSHGDEVLKLPDGFEKIGTTGADAISAAADLNRKIFTVQFHPEVSHCEFGEQLLANFVEFCGLKNSWKMEDFLQKQISQIRETVGDRKVFLFASGGVDSTVVFAILSRALKSEQIFAVLVDHGFLRENEAEQIRRDLSAADLPKLRIENAAEFFAAELDGETDPEKKRAKIGAAFLKVQQKIFRELNLNPAEWFLAQGTIYPDTIESGGEKNSEKIKTHHNRVDEILQFKKAGKLLEPLVELFKDEVRDLGRQLNLPKKLVARRPFPGPGLAVRVLGNQSADFRLQISEKNSEKIESEIFEKWKVAARVLPIRSVGVAGDGRTYSPPVAIFGEFGARKFSEWQKIATEIPNNFREISRVVFCLNRENSAEPQIFSAKLEKSRVEILRRADFVAQNFLRNLPPKIGAKVWQFPVVLLPIFFENRGGESIVLRPVESENAMTATAADFDAGNFEKLAKEISREIPEVENVFLDLTSKPPGTIEWE